MESLTLQRPNIVQCWVWKSIKPCLSIWPVVGLSTNTNHANPTDSSFWGLA